jgi:hypothetical protein
VKGRKKNKEKEEGKMIQIKGANVIYEKGEHDEK